MGNYQTAIAAVAAGSLILVAFGLLWLLRGRRHQEELILAIYGIAAGIPVTFILFLYWRITPGSQTVVNAVCNVLSLAVMLVSIHYMKPRRSPPKWLHIVAWIVLTTVVSAMSINFSPLCMGVH